MHTRLHIPRFVSVSIYLSVYLYLSYTYISPTPIPLLQLYQPIPPRRAGACAHAAAGEIVVVASDLRTRRGCRNEQVRHCVIV